MWIGGGIGYGQDQVVDVLFEYGFDGVGFLFLVVGGCYEYYVLVCDGCSFFDVLYVFGKYGVGQ